MPPSPTGSGVINYDNEAQYLTSAAASRVVFLFCNFDCKMSVMIERDAAFTDLDHVHWTVLWCFAVLRGRYQLQCFSRLLWHSSFLDWTIVTAFCLDFLPTSSRTSGLFRTLLRGSSSESKDQSILLRRSSAFTGCTSSPSSC